MALQKKVKKTRKLKEKDIDIISEEPTQEDVERVFREIEAADDDDYYPEEER
jgi:hypothetical protein